LYCYESLKPKYVTDKIISEYDNFFYKDQLNSLNKGLPFLNHVCVLFCSLFLTSCSQENIAYDCTNLLQNFNREGFYAEDSSGELFHYNKGLYSVQLSIKPGVLFNQIKNISKSEKYGNSSVIITLNDAGSKQFAQLTKKCIGKRIGVFIKDQLIEAPVVQQEIIGGAIAISSENTDDTRTKDEVYNYLSSKLICCDQIGRKEGNDIQKTASGEYYAKKGNFIVGFPNKPSFQKINRKIDTHEIQTNLYRDNLNQNNTFWVEYVDYPEVMDMNYKKHLLLSELRKGLLHNMYESYEMVLEDIREQHGLKSIYIVLYQREEFIRKNRKRIVKIQLFTVNNSIYTAAYAGYENENVDSVMKSFRLKK